MSNNLDEFKQANFGWDVVIAHGPCCNDGMTAAWCVWRTLPTKYREALGAEGGVYQSLDIEDTIAENLPWDEFIHPNSPEGAMKLQTKGFPTVFVFIGPSESVPQKLVENKRVIILDLDMGDALVSVVEAASFVLLVDHHDSTPVTLHKNGAVLYGLYRNKFGTYVDTRKSESGASLAWTLTHSAIRPQFVEIVRIGDTWQWNDFPELCARNVLEALYVKRAFRSFTDIESTFTTWDDNFKDYIQKGKALSEYKLSMVKHIAKQCDIGFIQTTDGNVYTVAYTQANILHSEVGSAIRFYAQKRIKAPIDLCATWKYVSYRNLVSVSLRDGSPGLKLSVIARNVVGTDGKGGGHDTAAGFTFFGLENFHKFILREKPVYTRGT